MGTLRQLAAAALLVLVSGVANGAAAEEEPLILSITDKLDYRRLDDGPVREEAFRNRLEVSAYRGIFSVWLRLQSLGISEADVYDPFGEGGDANGTRLSRRLFTAETERFRLQAGDVSWNFGRGLALSVFEDEELNFDSRLEGVVGSWSHDRGTMTVLGGANDGNRFRGLFARSENIGPVSFGTSFVEAWGGTTETSIRNREQQWGGLAEWEMGPFSAYAEHVRRVFPGRDGIGAEDEDGYGTFLSAAASAEGLTLSGEYRRYLQFDHEFHDPPTSLRQHTWTLPNRLNGQVLADINNNDVEGFLIEGDYSYDYFTSVRGSYSHSAPRENDNSFWELYGEAKTEWQEKVFLTLAAAESEFEFISVFDERISAFAEAVWEIDHTHSLAAGFELGDVSESDASTASFTFPHEYQEKIYSLTYSRSPWLSLTGSWETSSDDRESEENWGTVLAEVVLNESQDLLVSFGRERGGWKCSGGVCFFEPEFEGLKVRWVARY